MTVSSRPIVNFSAGEVSPKLRGRSDSVPYFAAAETLENVLVTNYGSAMNTPGTKFVARAKLMATASRLIPFTFSTGQSYILEFGETYMRVFQSSGSVVEEAKTITGITQAAVAVVTAGIHGYSNGDFVDIEGVVGMTQVNGKRFKVANKTSNTFELQDEDGNNVNSTAYTAYTSDGTAEKVYQITTPYDDADLAELKFTQQADVMYITHPDYAPRKLCRLGNASWTISEITYDTFSWPPFLPINTTATTITPSGTTGSVTLTASAALFQSGHVGSYWKLTHSTTDGYVLITAFTNTTTVTATVIETLGGTTATEDWNEGAWSEVQKYPSDVKFYEQRLYYVATDTKPLNVWGSVVEEYDNFKTGSADTDAVAYTIGSSQVDRILWLYPTSVLNLGTAGGPFTMSSGSSADPISPTNVSVKQQNENGAANVSPVRIGPHIYYVERSGKILGQFFYNLDTDSYITDNLTYLSDHILGGGVVEMALQKYPASILWCVLTDGTISTLTRETKNEVKGWSRQVISGTSPEPGAALLTEDGTFVLLESGDLLFLESATVSTVAAKVESIAVIPNGVEDQIWIVVARTVNNAVVRYIEYFMPQDFGTDSKDVFFVHSGLTYNGTATTTITGLDHLEGETVAVLADGAVHPSKVVTNGAITLDWSASVVHVGLSYTSTIKTMDLEAGSMTGTAQTKVTHISKVFVRLLRSLGCSVGDGTTQDTVYFRDSSMDMDAPPPLFTGDKEMSFLSGHFKNKHVVIKQDQPLPFHVLGIYPRMMVSD